MYKTRRKNGRKDFATTLNMDLIKKIKLLAIEQDKRTNELIEEGLELLLEKYKKN